MHAALCEVIDAVDARTLLVSFNDEGFVSEEELVAMLAAHGEVAVARFDYKRYVGAQIGIHNPDGERVGSVGKLRNRELLFAVAPRRTTAAAAVASAQAAR